MGHGLTNPVMITWLEILRLRMSSFSTDTHSSVAIGSPVPNPRTCPWSIVTSHPPHVRLARKELLLSSWSSGHQRKTQSRDSNLNWLTDWLFHCSSPPVRSVNVSWRKRRGACEWRRLDLQWQQINIKKYQINVKTITGVLSPVSKKIEFENTSAFAYMK